MSPNEEFNRAHSNYASRRLPRLTVGGKEADARCHEPPTTNYHTRLLNPVHHGVEPLEYDLTNLDGRDMETAREVRDEIESETAMDEACPSVSGQEK
jgi:hypothetical protein